MSDEWSTAARLLRRVGFGTTGGPQVDALVRGDWSTYVRDALDADPEADAGGARNTPAPTFATLEPVGKKSATMAQRKQFRQALGEQKEQLSQWWIRRMLAVQNPIHEKKLTLLWHNHFATSAIKVRNAQWMLAQNQTLRALKLGDFRTLAYAMLTDPAMMDWLDAQSNTAKSANENLAREFMELFTLGHGNGYTEEDVRQGARALTGWTLHAGAAPPHSFRNVTTRVSRRSSAAPQPLTLSASATRSWLNPRHQATCREGCGGGSSPAKLRRHPRLLPGSSMPTGPPAEIYGR